MVPQSSQCFEEFLSGGFTAHHGVGSNQQVIYRRQHTGIWVGLLYSPKSSWRTSLKTLGEVLNPCGCCVQITCLLHPSSASSHSKAKRGWLLTASGDQKIIHELQDGIAYPSRGKGPEGGVRAENSRMDTLNPLAYLSEVLHRPTVSRAGLLTSSREVFQTNWQGGKMPKFLKCLMWG